MPVFNQDSNLALYASHAAATRGRRYPEIDAPTRTDYQRDRDLKRLLRQAAAGGPEKTLPRLIHEENLLEETRKAGDASYSLTRHVELLIALLAELNLLPKSQQRPV